MLKRPLYADASNIILLILRTSETDRNQGMLGSSCPLEERGWRTLQGSDRFRSCSADGDGQPETFAIFLAIKH